MTASSAEANEITQETFISALRSLSRYQEKKTFKAWLYTLSKNHCLMRIRSEKKQNIVQFDVELMQSEENVHLNGVFEKEEDFKKLEGCLGSLADKQREAIRLFYLDGKCYNEITEMMDLDWNQVRSLIQNGRRNLKNCMEKESAAIIFHRAPT